MILKHLIAINERPQISWIVPKTNNSIPNTLSVLSQINVNEPIVNDIIEHKVTIICNLLSLFQKYFIFFMSDQKFCSDFYYILNNFQFIDLVLSLSSQRSIEKSISTKPNDWVLPMPVLPIKPLLYCCHSIPSFRKINRMFFTSFCCYNK